MSKKMNNTPNHINNLRSPVTHAPAQGARTEHPYALSRPNQPTQDPEDILDMELTQADDAPVDQAAETRSDVGDMSDDLDPKSHYTALQVTALSHLLTSSTIIEAAKRTGCNERTIRKWLADPVYKAEYLRARREAVEHASGNIQSLTELAAGGASPQPYVRHPVRRTPSLQYSNGLRVQKPRGFGTRKPHRRSRAKRSPPRSPQEKGS